METQSPPPPPPPPSNYECKVDTSRPFRSVKEAVAIFGERILVGAYNTNNNQITSSSSSSSSSTSSPSPPPPDISDNNELEGNKKETSSVSVEVLGTLKRLESELDDTKAELKLLKDREQETEVALASLNAQLHINMSRLAQAEAAAAAKALAAATARTTTAAATSSSSPDAASNIDAKEDIDREKESEEMTMRRRRKQLVKSMQKNTTLAQILSLENDAFFANSNKTHQNIMKTIKKKPIVPLVGDLFSFRKKTASFSSSNPQLLYASTSQFYHSS